MKSNNRGIILRIGRVNAGKFRIYGTDDFLTHVGKSFIEYGSGWTRKEAMRNFAEVYRNSVRIAEYLEFAYGAVEYGEFENRLHIVNNAEIYRC